MMWKFETITLKALKVLLSFFLIIRTNLLIDSNNIMCFKSSKIRRKKQNKTYFRYEFRLQKCLMQLGGVWICLLALAD